MTLKEAASWPTAVFLERLLEARVTRAPQGPGSRMIEDPIVLGQVPEGLHVMHFVCRMQPDPLNPRPKGARAEPPEIITLRRAGDQWSVCLNIWLYLVFGSLNGKRNKPLGNEY